MDSIPPKKENQERVKTLKKSINLELSPFDYFCFMSSKHRTLFEGLSKPKDFHKHIFWILESNHRSECCKYGYQ